ncbi:MAG: lipoprotein-releasing ABC transporter permease subunit [Gammaproteobacteria bacterium]|nr:lipoprotein-releasing ABC transporter permease subunit [Gammaproteobacteria bacterium]
MMRPYELFIGLRYLRAKRRNGFISVISLISMLGIAVGVMALITVLSVMNGFEGELRNRILSMTSHATISGSGERLTDWQAVIDSAERHPEVLGAAPYVSGQAMLNGSGRMSGALVRGVLPSEEAKVSEIESKMIRGSMSELRPGEYNIVLGRYLAYSLGAQPGDSVIMLISQGNVTPAGIMPRMRRFNVVGIFEAGMYEYDSTLALVNLEDASRLFGMNGEVSGVRIKLTDMFQARRISRELVDYLDGVYYLSDWTRQHANFFRAIATEKTVMFVILTLIVAVAAFNIISTLVMVVTDKQSDIAILRTLGATPRAIMSVFMVQGTFIGLLGTAIGVSLGVLLSLNVENIIPALESFLGTDLLPDDVYYISDLPSKMEMSDVVTVGITAFTMSMLAGLYPAWRASRTQPAEALRHE